MKPAYDMNILLSHQLIDKHPFFESLKNQKIDELLKLAFEKDYKTQEIVVRQGEVIDSFYLIIEGEVEVAIAQPDSNLLIPIAILKEGDAIGLNSFGLFSQSGVRTATLTAIKDLRLIGWRIDDFHSFLQSHPTFKSSMVHSFEVILRMNLIRQVESFASLPAEKLLYLAKQIKEITVPKGTIIFHQGEIGEKCYLVCSGKVEILLVPEEGPEKQLALIEPFGIFGELAILTRALRNATARMIEDGKLLVLESDQLQELTKHQSTFDSIMTLIVDRCRPIRKAHIEIYHITTQDNEALTILKDPVCGRYFKLSNEGWHLWQLLDGSKNLQSLMVELFTISSNYNIGGIADTLFNLADAGFVHFPDVEIPSNNEDGENLGLYDHFKINLKKLTHLSFTFTNMDDTFTALYEYFGIFYKPLGKFISSTLIFLGIISNFFYLPRAIAEIQVTDHLIVILAAVFFTNLISVFLHELGHGLTTKYFNREVKFIGLKIIWFGLGLVFFVDTSDMWLSNKRSRIIVSLAGPYTDLLIAGLASLLAWVIPQYECALFFYLLALTLYYSVYKNLNPIFENDGYAALKEMFNDPNLIKSAYSELKNINSWHTNRTILIYWSICLLFLIIGILLAFVFQHYLHILFPTILGISSVHLIWIIPSLVILRFFMILRVQFKKFSM